MWEEEGKMSNEFSFEANDVTIKDVLFSQRKFRVPKYQRPYAWGIEQITEFWNDLTTNSEPYFLGSFVFCTEEQETSGFTEITDGQQRLLTITIFTAVLRDIAKSLDGDTSQRIQRQDISFEDREGGEAFRILPDETISDFYLTNIQKFDSKPISATPKTVEERRIIDNYNFFYERVQNYLKNWDSKAERLAKLNELRNKVSDLIVINIEIAREEDAYEIFETTNARGIDLSVADLLKNLIFKKMAATQNRDLAKNTWLEITSNIEGTGIELKKFIRYYWLSKYTFVTEKRLYREIRNNIVDWKFLLDDLLESSVWFYELVDPEEETYVNFKHGHEIYKSIFALSLMGVSQCYVLLLSILRNYENLGTNPERLIRLIEKFTFVYSVVCKLPGNKVERIYSRYAQQLEKAIQEVQPKKLSGVINSIFSSIEKELKAEKPNRQFFIESFEDIAYKPTEKARRLIKYILERIDEHGGTREYKIDFNNVNIEHILPQKPDKLWGLSTDEITEYVNKLGNLTLLSEKINGDVQNKIIEKKLPELKTSKLLVTKTLVKRLVRLKGKWGEKQIAERHKGLAEIAYDHIWSF